MTKRAFAAICLIIALMIGTGFLIWKLFSGKSAAPPSAAVPIPPEEQVPLPQFASISTLPIGPVVYNVAQGTTHSFALASIKAARRLLERDHYLTASKTASVFDEAMKSAVAEYQRTHDLAVTGAIGSLTRHMMNQEIQAGRKLEPDSNLRMTRSRIAASSAYVELAIPLIEQQYPLSCEVASLQMALRYKGIEKNQDELLAKIGIAEPKAKYRNTQGKYVWGDPNEAFVGDVRGWLYGLKSGMLTATGWGVNRAPIARVAKEFRPGSEDKSGTVIADIIKEIEHGNPVITWNYEYLPTELLTLKEYLTPKGARIPFTPTHVKLVVGFKKASDGNYTLLMNDPEDGREEIPADKFLGVWARYDHDMVVIR
ncbi:MAG: C39 family peptidase [Candidatus Liptonbacteria bacterium]|nr:C39 family peptidase [Candidatus Liptonbacteria bacterium]